MRRRLRARARRLVEEGPRTAEELERLLRERPWARPFGELVSGVVAECRLAGMLGGKGHARALRDRLFNYGANLLAHAPRTEHELRRRLSRPVWSEPGLVDDVVGALKRYGYIDDAEFARRFAERKASAGKSGARLLKLELRARGVRGRAAIDEAVREAFEHSPESESVDALIERRTASRPLKGPEDLRRLRDFLLRRGFEPELVYDKLRALRIEGVADGQD